MNTAKSDINMVNFVNQNKDSCNVTLSQSDPRLRPMHVLCTYVCRAPGPAAAQHEPDGGARDVAGEPAEVGVDVGHLVVDESLVVADDLVRRLPREEPLRRLDVEVGRYPGEKRHS